MREHGRGLDGRMVGRRAQTGCGRRRRERGRGARVQAGRADNDDDDKQSRHYPSKLVIDALSRNVAGLAVGKVSWRVGSTVILHLYSCRTTAVAVFVRPDPFLCFFTASALTRESSQFDYRFLISSMEPIIDYGKNSIFTSLVATNIPSRI